MKRPYEGKTCPKDPKLRCIHCGWYLRDGMTCKLGYIRENGDTEKRPGRDYEYTTKW